MSELSTPDLARRRASPPTSYEALRSSIAGRYPDLSRRLQQVAEYALAHPDDMALETIAVIADRAGVPPSSLIRFAKALDFEGFSDMQRLFRARLVDRTPSYGERIRSLRTRHEGADRPVPSLVLDDFVAANIEALERVRRELPPERLDRAVQILARAEGIYVAAQRRSFPVAAYLSYLLSQLERRSHLLDSIGGMLEQQARAIGQGDALIAVSFRSYAPQVLGLLQRCAERGVPTIVITDGPLSPLTQFATVSFEVIEAEVETFRSLSASMCLALVLVVALGHRLETARSGHRAK
jgi:DNA-binding MurR/RpiR family transcriptional regulator